MISFPSAIFRNCISLYLFDLFQLLTLGVVKLEDTKNR
jgi:hypothetical protein